MSPALGTFSLTHFPMGLAAPKVTQRDRRSVLQFGTCAHMPAHAACARQEMAAHACCAGGEQPVPVSTTGRCRMCRRTSKIRHWGRFRPRAHAACAGQKRGTCDVCGQVPRVPGARGQALAGACRHKRHPESARLPCQLGNSVGFRHANARVGKSALAAKAPADSELGQVQSSTVRSL